MRRRLRWLAVLLTPLLILVVYLGMQSPTHQGPWIAAQSRLPELTVAGDSYHIRHIRDFRYHADGSPSQLNYLERSYHPTDLQRVWLGISHFAGGGLAHTFLSFEFAGDDFLVASVEARLRPGQSYKPLAGLLRRYNRLVVLGTEEDVIGLRSHIRAERVLLYPLELNDVQRRHLWSGIMADVELLSREPAFYNTLLDNCTTNLLKHDPGHRLLPRLLDYRLLLPGFSDGFARDRGWIADDLPLQEMRTRARVDPQGVDVDDPGFSRAIRAPGLRAGEIAP